jgi:hypothetical protein
MRHDRGQALVLNLASGGKGVEMLADPVHGLG